MNDTNWQTRAACTGESAELFFPTGATGPALLQIEEARAVCRRCPVMDTCGDYALEQNMTDGVWGGLTEDERRAIKRRDARLRAIRAAEAETEAVEPAEPTPTTPRETPKCGTRGGYRRHKRLGEPIDQACRDASAEADRLFRNTGSTKARAA